MYFTSRSQPLLFIWCGYSRSMEKTKSFDKILANFKIFWLIYTVFGGSYATLIHSRIHQPDYITIDSQIFANLLILLSFVLTAFFIVEPFPSSKDITFDTPKDKNNYQRFSLFLLIPNLLISLVFIYFINKIGEGNNNSFIWLLKYLILFLYFIPVGILSDFSNRFRIKKGVKIVTAHPNIEKAEYINGSFIYTTLEDLSIEGKLKVNDLVTINNLFYTDGSSATHFNLTYGVVASIDKHTFTITHHKDVLFDPVNNKRNKTGILMKPSEVEPIVIIEPISRVAVSKGDKGSLVTMRIQDTSYDKYQGKYEEKCQCFRCQPEGVKYVLPSGIISDFKILARHYGAGFVTAYMGYTLYVFFGQRTLPVAIAIILYLLAIFIFSRHITKSLAISSSEYKIDINPEILKFINDLSTKIGTNIKFVGPPRAIFSKSDRNESIKRGLDVESNAAFLPTGDKTGMVMLGHAYQNEFDDITKSVIVHELGHSVQPWFKLILPITYAIKGVLFTLNLMLLKDYSLTTFLTSSILINLFISLLSSFISRYYERDADIFAAKVLGSEVAVKAFTNFSRLGIGRDTPGLIAPLFKSHPNNSKRIKYLESYIVS